MPRLSPVITAFGNADGGLILVGVGDKGEIVGTNLEEVGRTFHSALAIVRNAPRVDLEAVSLDGRQLATITVGKGDRLVLAEEGALTRVGDHVEVMPAEAISRAVRPDLPDERATLAASIHDLTDGVAEVRTELEFSNSFRGQLRNCLVGGGIGAVLGFILSALLR